MAESQLTLPYPPSVNRYWRKWNNRMVISSEGRRYRDAVSAVLQGCRTLQNKLSLLVDVFPPDKRRRDIDNILKALLDAMEKGGLYVDDNQIIDLHVRKWDSVPPGRVDITLKEITCS